MKIIALAAVAALLAAPACAHSDSVPEPATLTVQFETGADTGAVMVSLFEDEAVYASRTAARRARVDVAAGERVAVFEGLRPGTYAVTAFHDVDGDGRLGTNPFGVPAEPYAFSNDARGNMGPPTWEQARFPVAGKTAHIIQIR